MTLVHHVDYVAEKQVISVPGQIINGQQADYFSAFVNVAIILRFDVGEHIQETRCTIELLAQR